MGERIGKSVGEPVGMEVGKPVGLNTGDKVGEVVGEAVGLAVGSDVGDSVGKRVLKMSFGVTLSRQVSPLSGGAFAPGCGGAPKISSKSVTLPSALLSNGLQTELEADVQVEQSGPVTLLALGKDISSVVSSRKTSIPGRVIAKASVSLVEAPVDVVLR